MKEQEKLIGSPFDLYKHFRKGENPNGFPLSTDRIFEAIVDHALVCMHTHTQTQCGRLFHLRLHIISIGAMTN